jgi:hypothetical protein
MKEISITLFRDRCYHMWCITLLLFLFTSPVFSQDEASSIRQHFTSYQHNTYQEKVFLHTDKSVYVTGEVLWFKAYITNAADNSLSPLSSICYVEVFNEEKKPLLQAKISIDSGTGNGSFILPSFLRTGNYLVRAYTNWMKNFDPSFYFESQVTIINVAKKEQAPDTLNTAAYHAAFFPEGGNLVSGFDNTLACKITDRYGRGVEGSGSIMNDQNQPVVDFVTGHFGMGHFTFNPAKGNKYHAVVHVNNTTLNPLLPEIYASGWVMHVEDKGNTLSINVSCNIETEHNVFLFAQTRQQVKIAKSQPFVNGLATIQVDKAAIGDGITQFTIFNEKRQPVCERLYFKKPANLVQLNLNGIGQHYVPRQRVALALATSDTSTNLPGTNMSVSVYLTDPLQPQQDVNLLNYLWLTSDLRGTVESPQYYFSDTDTGSAKAADDLMLTQGWRRFAWEDVLKDANPSFSFLPEHEGHIITGRISPKVAGLTDTGIVVYLSVPGKNFRFSCGTSAESGYMRFNVDKFYGSHELIAQTNVKDSNYHLFIDNPFSENVGDTRVAPAGLQLALADAILLRSIGAQAGNSFLPARNENFTLPKLYDTTSFSGIPSKTYYLDNYTRFPTMEEVMREYVKEVHVRNRQKIFHYEVFNEPEINYFDADPLVLIDGVPVFNVNRIIEMDPLKIKKIDVTTNRFFAGKKNYDGIVSYSTYNEDLDGYQLDPNSLVLEYEGLQFKREFYAPQYDNPQQSSARIPDYRNVLYWSPEVPYINGKQGISFYTSDIPGTYVVVVQGITNSSVPVFATSTFTVLPAGVK